MGEQWTRLGKRVGVKYRHTAPDHFDREHDIQVGYDGVYLTNAELLALTQVSGVYRRAPEVQALVATLENCQRLLQRWSAYLEVEDRLGDGGIVIETIKENKRALAPFQEAGNG